MTSNPDDDRDFDLPLDQEDEACTGAAADSGDLDARLKDLPRLLRYAALLSSHAGLVAHRLIAEIEELCPGLPETSAWSDHCSVEDGLALSAVLDHRAVIVDQPELRSLADCVRLMCLPNPRVKLHAAEHGRVGKALVFAFRNIETKIDNELCCELERFVCGWAALPSCTDIMTSSGSAASNAAYLGASLVRNQLKRTSDLAAKQAGNVDEPKAPEPTAKTNTVSTADESPKSGIVVAQIGTDEMKGFRIREVLGPFKSAINVHLPLVPVPDLREARSVLASEFPYALEVIDFALADLVGRTTIRLRPLLLSGDVGGGKTLFCRRLGEVIGLPIARYDASRADGATFAGTDRRWNSAEPCHPFLAVARGRVANPMVLIDEIDKPAVRRDWGHLWDCLLGFLDVESNSRYPDPALQVDLDLSQVSFVATANEIDSLPSPLRDRFRVVLFPRPSAEHFDALLPSVAANLAKERGLDARWIAPFDEMDRKAMARLWGGGSVRKLRQIVEAVLLQRETMTTRH